VSKRPISRYTANAGYVADRDDLTVTHSGSTQLLVELINTTAPIVLARRFARSRKIFTRCSALRNESVMADRRHRGHA
jgi:hypothetical protein